MHGLVALDAAGEVIRPAILWNDGRTAAECAEIEERVGLERLIALPATGRSPASRRPKLLWLRKHEPEAYGRIARIMLPKDYVRWRLCGEHAIDMADASGTLLLDVARPALVRRGARRAGDRARRGCRGCSSRPRSRARRRTGVPVAAGAGDQAAGALGVGVDRPGPLSVALGTSGVVFAALPAFAADERARVHAFCHAVPGGWHAMGVMLSAAGSLALAARHGRAGRGVRRAGRGGRGLGARGGGLTFLPYLAGERTPHADPYARGSFTGLTPAPRPRRARPRACSRASPTGCATRSTCWSSWASGPSAAASRAAARAPSCGCGSSPPCSRSRSSGRWSRRARRTAPRSWAASRAASGPRRTRRSPRACGSRGEVEPEPAWIEPYAEGRARFRALYPAIRDAQG